MRDGSSGQLGVWSLVSSFGSSYVGCESLVFCGGSSGGLIGGGESEVVGMGELWFLDGNSLIHPTGIEERWREREGGWQLGRISCLGVWVGLCGVFV